MSITLTGHTSGIGKSIGKLFENKGYKVFGFSRTNGFDLEKDFEKMLSNIITTDSDIFINNAYVVDNQTKLLKKVYQEWKFKNKLIINIGSIASIIPPNHPDYGVEYVKNKREQREFCQEHNFLYSKTNFNKIKCGLVNVNCDYVNTPFKSKYDKRKFPNLSSNEVAEVISFIIECFNKNICIREINLHSTKNPILIK